MDDADVVAKLENARIQLLLNWPLFGDIIIHLPLKEAKWCKTAATDGKFFYYCKEFVSKLSKEQTLFLTAHEVSHVLLLHIFRYGNGRDPDIMNMAMDYIINYMLIHTKDNNGNTIGKIIEKVAPVDKILYNPLYTDEFTVEELYDLLAKNKAKKQNTLDMHLKGGDGGDDGSKESDEDGGGDNGDEKQDSKSGNELSDDEDGPPKYTQSEIDAIKENMLNVVIQSITHQNNINPGSVPAGLMRMLNDLLEPKFDWKTMLDNVLRTSIKYDYTYARKSRRTYKDIILPGRNVLYKVKAAIFMDASGSTTQEMISDFMSEVCGIVNTFRDFEITIGTFDTEVYNVVTLTPSNVDELYTYDFRGDGGTRPSCCWDYLAKNEIIPHRIILFTDGYVGDDWGDRDSGIETLFVIHSNPRTVAPYGKTCHYEL